MPPGMSTLILRSTWTLPKPWHSVQCSVITFPLPPQFKHEDIYRMQQYRILHKLYHVKVQKIKLCKNSKLETMINILVM